MNKYTVRIIMDELEICAESEDKANEIAQNIVNLYEHWFLAETLRSGASAVGWSPGSDDGRP